jgi:ABC-type Fe3+-siderophore transport system permease subunit
METPTPAREADNGTDLALAAAAGLAAAIAAGVIWALIVKISDYEIGVAAWGIGFLVGTAVVFAARRRKSTTLAAVAVVAALVGILVGKYLSFVFVARHELGESYGFLSGDTWNLFMDNKSVVFSFWDVLWIGLAVVTAWRVAHPAEPDDRHEPEPESV